MAKARNEILPGAVAWDSFMTNKCSPCLKHSDGFQRWTCGSQKIRRQVQFLDAYAQEPRFAKLLAALTNYHLMPEDGKSLTRKIVEVSNQCCSENLDAWFTPREGRGGAGLDLYDWKSIAEIIVCKNSPAQLRTEFYREKRRRQSISSKWKENFEAWEELARRNGELLLPLQTVSVRD